MALKRCHCPKINPEDWEGKEFDWEKKTFYFLSIKNFFHKPLDLAEKIRQLKKEVAGKAFDLIDPNLVLCEWAQFNGNLISQVKPPDRYDENILIFDFGKIYSTVFKGPKKLLKQTVDDFHSKTELDYNIPVQKIYLWYVHCDECAKEREHLTVIFAKT
jgi:hypothetical protein